MNQRAQELHDVRAEDVGVFVDHLKLDGTLLVGFAGQIRAIVPSHVPTFDCSISSAVNQWMVTALVSV